MWETLARAHSHVGPADASCIGPLLELPPPQALLHACRRDHLVGAQIGVCMLLDHQRYAATVPGLHKIAICGAKTRIVSCIKAYRTALGRRCTPRPSPEAVCTGTLTGWVDVHAPLSSTCWALAAPHCGSLQPCPFCWWWDSVWRTATRFKGVLSPRAAILMVN